MMLKISFLQSEKLLSSVGVKERSVPRDLILMYYFEAMITINESGPFPSYF